MKISNLLDENTIEFNLRSTSVEEVIRELIQSLAKNKKVKNAQEIFPIIVEKDKPLP